MIEQAVAFVSPVLEAFIAFSLIFTVFLMILIAFCGLAFAGYNVYRLWKGGTK